MEKRLDRHINAAVLILTASSGSGRKLRCWFINGVMVSGYIQSLPIDPIDPIERSANRSFKRLGGS